MKKNSVSPLFLDQKLSDLGKLGGASKQLAKRTRGKKLARRCHIAMAYIVNDIWGQRETIFETHPELKEFMEALMVLYKDCENGHAEEYINTGNRI